MLLVANLWPTHGTITIVLQANLVRAGNTSRVEKANITEKNVSVLIGNKADLANDM